MVGSTAKNSGVKTTALFAYAAGVTGILANLLLIAFFALQAGNPGRAGPSSARPTIWSGRSVPRS